MTMGRNSLFEGLRVTLYNELVSCGISDGLLTRRINSVVASDWACSIAPRESHLYFGKKKNE